MGGENTPALGRGMTEVLGLAARCCWEPMGLWLPRLKPGAWQGSGGPKAEAGMGHPILSTC